MGVENLSAASGVESEPVEREDPEARKARQTEEVDAARRARAERLGHEVVQEETKKAGTKAEKQEAEAEEPAPKKAAKPKKTE